MSDGLPQYSREEAGEINQTLLAVNFRINQSERVVAGAFINLNERTMMMTEFLDNEHLSGLESLIIQLNNSSPDSRFRLLINMPTDLLKDKITDILGMCEVEYTVGNKKDFSSNQVQHTLNSLLKESFSYKIEESEMELALAALSAAIDHMNLKTGSKPKQFTLKKYTLSQYLRLDVAAIKALNLFPQNSESGISGQAGSIFGMLNQCRTSIGARLLKKWLKQPTTNREGRCILSCVRVCRNKPETRHCGVPLYQRSH
jgi:DNA mismatch repair protein MSH2